MMMPRVFCRAHYSEVGRGVVARVLVLVVNQLLRRQESTDDAFHDEPVLHDISVRVRVRMMRLAAS